MEWIEFNPHRELKKTLLIGTGIFWSQGYSYRDALVLKRQG
jgi:hypothetical protein